MAKFCLKLLPAILLLFAFDSVWAQAPVKTADTIPIHVTDTTRRKIIDYIIPPLTLPFISTKTTCDAAFSETAQGGVGPFSYSSSNLSVATIDPVTGLIKLTGTAGVSIISVTDAQNLKTTAKLTVNQASEPTVTIAESQPLSCATGPATFTATPGKGLTNCIYTWFRIVGTTGAIIPYGNNGAAVLVLNTLVTGDEVYCTMTTTSGCSTSLGGVKSNSITATVLPNSILTVSISQSPEGTIESGTPITFTANPTLTPPYDPATYTYQWQKNNVDIPNATNATYTSTCSLNYDYYNCIVSPIVATAPCVTKPSATAPVGKQVTIVNSGLPVMASITVSTNNVYAGTVINFQAMLSPNAHAVAYQWQINGADTSDVTSTLSTFSLKNNDVVTCVIFTDNGCQQVVVSNPIKMVIFPTPKIIIPNTFTPNGDNFNDVWDIKYMDLYHYATIKIYNRYGALLFHSTGYGIPWDGKYKGTVVPSGTYYYVINLNNGAPEIGGAVNVIK